jgi:hypothetical protein
MRGVEIIINSAIDEKSRQKGNESAPIKVAKSQYDGRTGTQKAEGRGQIVTLCKYHYLNVGWALSFADILV